MFYQYQLIIIIFKKYNEIWIFTANQQSFNQRTYDATLTNAWQMSGDHTSEIKFVNQVWEHLHYIYKSPTKKQTQ